MSDVNPDDQRKIESCKDVIHTYKGAGAQAKAGLEIELAFFDPRSPDLAPMSPCQNKALKNAANDADRNDFLRNEPTAETLEISSIAAGPDDLRAILDDAQTHINTLSQKAQGLGLKRSYFQHLPDKTAPNLLKNVMDIPRYQAFFGPPREDFQDIAAYFAVCKSNQVSVSYRDPDHLLKNIRRLYALAPFLFMITDNTAPFDQGKPFTGHAGMAHRASLKGRGGVPDYLLTARTGEDYIRAHIEHVMANPLFVYYNDKGELVRLPSGTWTSFNALREQGLNTATNYLFSESVLWPDVKIAALKNRQDQVVNHRFEARMFGVGLHQHQTALLITAALAFDETFAAETDALLGAYGFDLNTPENLRAPLTAAYDSARTHNGKFLDIPYGTDTMSAFAQDFAALMERAALMENFEDELAPVLTICRTGCTDAKVNALLFDTQDKARNFQRDYDPEIFEDPNNCAAALFEKELEKHCRGRRSQRIQTRTSDAA